MIRFWRRLAALAAAVMLCLFALPVPAEEAYVLPDAAALTMQYSGASSLQWALYADGDIAASGALNAQLEPGDETLLYGIGSVSKVYTAAAAMKLAEQGLLSLDTPVAEVLPEFTMADERYTQITLRMLLNHSSGLMFAGMKDAFLFDDPLNTTAADFLLEELSTQRLIADPGAYSVYCNAGFTLAQLVIERVSGMTLADYLRAEFLAPAGLTDTFACADGFDRTRLADACMPMDPTRTVASDCVTLTGTGGLYATAGDLARFGGVLTGQGGLLSEESLTAMAADEYARGLWPQDSEHDLLSFGLGWDAVHMFPFSLGGVQVLCKGGDTNLYHAALVVAPEYGMAAAVLTAGGTSLYNELLGARLLIDALAERDVTIPEEAALPDAQAAQMPAELMALSGVYAASTAVLYVDVSPEGVLSLTQVEGEASFTQTFAYCDDGSFRDETGTILVRLTTEENGETYLFQQMYSPVPGLTTMAVASYAAQRLEENPVDDEVMAAWQAREGKRYFLLDARYTSQLYALLMPYTYVAFDDALPGYVSVDRIADANTLESVVQIPGTAGRDGMDMVFVEEDDLEYLLSPGYRYVEEAAVQPLQGVESVTIGEEGYACWFSVDEALAGSLLTVVLPERGSFSAYDANALPVACSAAYGDTACVLPEGGYLVFAGEPGECFTLSVE